MDPDPAESPLPDEPEIATRLADQIRTVIQRQYDGESPPKTALRDAHAKIVGVVRAEVRVPDDLPAELRHGAWKPGAVYKAWVRYSNGDGTRQSDGAKDARGMAVKLCGVTGAGERLPGDSESTTQDFVMIDNPVFFIRNARDYVEFVDGKVAGKSPLSFIFPSWWRFWRWRIRELFIMLALQKKPPSHLGQTYHSMTPYKLGPHVVKVRARPLGEVAHRSGDGPDSLRAALEAQLATGEARFALEVQLRGNTELSVEDATERWSEAIAPFARVAEIVIPKQACGSDAQRAFGDRLSMSPWHGWMDHRPLGSLNRMRRRVYPASSVLRHDLNATPMIEPTGDETF